MNRLKVHEHLMPCPFCGGKADVVTDSLNGYDLKYVRCLTCGCRTDYFVMDKENVLLIQAWNRRPDDPLSILLRESQEITKKFREAYIPINEAKEAFAKSLEGLFAIKEVQDDA